MSFQKFYRWNQKEIVTQLADFFETDFFAKHSHYRGKLSLILTGSIPLGDYDQYSDLDAEFCFQHEADRAELKKIVKTYKQSLKKRNIPIQLHPSKTFTEIREHQIRGWTNDDAIREYASALIVIDPDDRYALLQKEIKWYPKDVYKEKMHWLFAEAVFTYADRFLIAKKRGDLYYMEAMKIHLMRLLGNAMLMLHKDYPSFDKHLYSRLMKLPQETTFVRVFDRLLQTSEPSKMDKISRQLLNIVEKKMITAKLTTKRDQRYWIDLRPKYQVEILSR